MLQEITFDYKKRILLDVWKWECYKCYKCYNDFSPSPRIKENLRRRRNLPIPLSCYDWIAWRAFSPSITHAVHGISTDCTFCDGHVPLKHKKTRKRGESSVPFVINEKFRWLFLFRAEVNKKSMVQSPISDERTMFFIPSDNLIFCPKVHQMFWSAQMGLHRKTLSQVPW